MKSLFEEMGGTYRQVGDYLIPNLVLPDDGDYQIGKYGRMRRSYLKEHRKILYTNYVMEGTLFKHLSEIDQACNERMEIIVPAMAKQEGVTEALKAADQMEWVRRMNSIRNRAEEIAALESALQKLSEQEEKYSAELDEALKQYAELKEQAAGMDAVELMDARLAVREEQERSVASRVKSAYGEKYDPMMMQDSKRDVANLLNEETEARSIRERLRQKQQAQQKQNKKKSRDRWER